MDNVKGFSSEERTRGESVVRRIGEVTAAQGINWSIPNLITVLRILMTPLFIGFLIYGMKIPALFVFCLSGISDALDGLIARRYHLTTELGALLDPLADKILLTASFWVLSSMGVLPIWLTILVVSRDVLIVCGALFLRSIQGQPMIVPSFLGKVTTCFQLATIFWALLLVVFFDGLWVPYLSGLFFAAAVITFVSGIHYLLGFMRRVGEPS